MFETTTWRWSWKTRKHTPDPPRWVIRVRTGNRAARTARAYYGMLHEHTSNPRLAASWLFRHNAEMVAGRISHLQPRVIARVKARSRRT